MPDTRLPVEFRDHQASVLGILDRARPLLNSKDPAVWAPLSTFRADLMRALNDYQVYKHRVLFNPIIESGSIERKGLAIELKADCVKLGNDYRDYTTKWQSMDTDGRWAEYRLAGLSMMRHIREALAREDDLVRQLLKLAPRS